MLLFNLRTLLRDPRRKIFSHADLETFADHGLTWFNTAEPPTALSRSALDPVKRAAVLWAAVHLACRHALEHHVELDFQTREDYEQLRANSIERFDKCRSIKWAMVRE